MNSCHGTEHEFCLITDEWNPRACRSSRATNYFLRVYRKDCERKTICLITDLRCAVMCIGPNWDVAVLALRRGHLARSQWQRWKTFAVVLLSIGHSEHINKLRRRFRSKTRRWSTSGINVRGSSSSSSSSLSQKHLQKGISLSKCAKMHRL